MKDKKEKSKKVDKSATTRLSSEEVNKKAKNKKYDDMSKTQVIGKSDLNSEIKKNKKVKNKKEPKKKKLKLKFYL